VLHASAGEELGVTPRGLPRSCELSTSSVVAGPRDAVLTIEPVELVGGAFIEGFRAFVTVDGSEYDDDALDEALALRLAPGEYRVHERIRPCAANCGNHDEGNVCSRTVELAPGDRPHIVPVNVIGQHACAWRVGGTTEPVTCDGHPKRAHGEPVTAGMLRGTAWAIESVRGCAVEQRSISFDRTTYRASLDCNSQQGRWSFADRRLQIRATRSTTVGCFSPLDIVEDAVRGTRFDDGDLVLVDVNGDELARGVRVSN
jgi:hypothetical protein